MTREEENAWLAEIDLCTTGSGLVKAYHQIYNLYPALMDSHVRLRSILERVAAGELLEDVRSSC